MLNKSSVSQRDSAELFYFTFTFLTIHSKCLNFGNAEHIH